MVETPACARGHRRVRIRPLPRVPRPLHLSLSLPRGRVLVLRPRVCSPRSAPPRSAPLRVSSLLSASRSCPSPFSFPALPCPAPRAPGLALSMPLAQCNGWYQRRLPVCHARRSLIPFYLSPPVTWKIYAPCFQQGAQKVSHGLSIFFPSSPSPFFQKKPNRSRFGSGCGVGGGGARELEKKARRATTHETREGGR